MPYGTSFLRHALEFFFFFWGTNCTLTKAASIPARRQNAQGILDLFFDTAPHLEYFFQFLELSTKAAFAKAASSFLLLGVGLL